MAPISDAAVPLNACYQSIFGAGGYVYWYNDGVSTSCVDSASLCGAGTTTMSQTTDAGTLYGGGIGINLNQLKNGGDGGALVPTGSALTYAVTAIPTYGLQINLTDPGGKIFAYSIPAGGAPQGTIPWSSFNTLGYDNPIPPSGQAFSTSDTIIQINFQAPSGAQPAHWSFCVTSLGL